MAEAVLTGEVEVFTGRDQNGKFVKGYAGGPGRPKDSQTRIGLRRFIDDLTDAWEAHGVEALEIVAKTEPSTFVRIVGATLPPELIRAHLGVTEAKTPEQTLLELLQAAADLPPEVLAVLTKQS